MTRPEIIRADTLDLQNTDAPSAQDHSHQPVQPAPLGIGPPAPHQDASIRHVSQERHAEQEYLADTWANNQSGHPEINDDDQREFVDGALEDSEPRGNSLHDRGDATNNDGETDYSAEGEDASDDDMLDKVSSSPSIEDEDIDFEFVYALHTFVATVEGQANATKGDTMVLLDDSNSYWWLVRVVKDSSIGYLPAEHIETPTERLARLNKHRNIDLSATMLGDNPERSKNPLKKAMRRRNAKMVQFSAPTYYDPPDAGSFVDGEHTYEERHRTFLDKGEGPHPARLNTVDASDRSTNGEVREATSSKVREAPRAQGAGDIMRTSFDDSRESDEIALSESDTSSIPRPDSSRDRDTLLTDYSAEPKKISLTPNLLRDDTSLIKTRSNETVTSSGGSTAESLTQAGKTSPELRKSPSPTLTRVTSHERMKSNAEKAKLEKAKREKKPGMLSGLFKRKEKKIKVDEAAGGTLAKTEDGDLRRTDSPVNSGTSSPIERVVQLGPAPTVQKATVAPVGVSSVGTLTKTMPAGQDASASQVPPRIGSRPQAADAEEDRSSSPTKAFDSMLNPNRPVDSAMQEAAQLHNPQTAQYVGGQRVDSLYEEIKQGPYTPYSQQSRAATSFDDAAEEPAQSEQRSMEKRPVQATPRLSEDAASTHSHDRNRSPEQAAPENILHQQQYSSDQQMDMTTTLPEIVSGTSENVTRPMRPITAQEQKTQQEQKPQSSRAPSQQSSSRTSRPPSILSNPIIKEIPQTEDSRPDSKSQDMAYERWDDESLRAYLDGHGTRDVLDLLLVIRNKAPVRPVSKNHPIMVESGFQAHQKQLNAMSAQLDGLLHAYMTKRSTKSKTSQRP